MERVSLSSGGSKVKESFRSENNFKFDKDYPYAYPWPPRYYTCSFCQREFKSAQALGGHMNIHRRDRAKLRDQATSPPPNNDHINDNLDQNPSLNPNPNPNPNPVSFAHPCSTSNSNIYAHQYSLVSLSLSSLPPPAMKNGEKLGPASTGDGFGRDYPEQKFEKWKYSMSSTFEHHHEEHEVRIINHGGSTTKEIVRLDLELCLGDHANQDLDLELRLGI